MTEHSHRLGDWSEQRVSASWSHLISGVTFLATRRRVGRSSAKRVLSLAVAPHRRQPVQGT